jgi:hypothetical protein
MLGLQGATGGQMARQGTFPPIRLTVWAMSQTDLWIDLGQFAPTIGVTLFTGAIRMTQKSGNLRGKIGVQSFTDQDDAPNSPVAPVTGTGLGYVTVIQTPQRFSFDPAGGTEGDIDTKLGWRPGLWYSTSDGAIGWAEFIVDNMQYKIS